MTTIEYIIWLVGYTLFLILVIIGAVWFMDRRAEKKHRERLDRMRKVYGL